MNSIVYCRFNAILNIQFKKTKNIFRFSFDFIVKTLFYLEIFTDAILISIFQIISNMSTKIQILLSSPNIM